MDNPIAFRMGCNTSHNNLKSPEQATWANWPMRRQEALISWLTGKFDIDRERVSVSMGAWGMSELERPDLYAMIHGKSREEVLAFVERVSKLTGLKDPKVLFSTKELKKTPPRYFAG